MGDPRAALACAAVVAGLIALAVVLSERRNGGGGGGGGGGPPQPTGAPAVLLEAYAWAPLLLGAAPLQPLLYFGLDGATAAYDPGAGQCWTLADARSPWMQQPASGQPPQLGSDGEYSNGVGTSGGVAYVAASSGAVWATSDCQA